MAYSLPGLLFRSDSLCRSEEGEDAAIQGRCPGERSALLPCFFNRHCSGQCTGQRTRARVRMVVLLRSRTSAASQAADEAARRAIPHHHAGRARRLRRSASALFSLDGFRRSEVQVYLARKRETSEICALKKMRKRTLAKMDEVTMALCFV